MNKSGKRFAGAAGRAAGDALASCGNCFTGGRRRRMPWGGCLDQLSRAQGGAPASAVRQARMGAISVEMAPVT
ncbi:hypothetical protein CNQ84_05185 [Pseudomonas abyssi]|uniref:Uncharacterized protein n=1 Tax=Pseudomonas abyssi TaxID=170540 RepID=A0A2A3MK64_9PSED|nr:hypothetical protein [Pseudomonadales bacterium]PBK05183.1 hypothetical protein CNQ84_05185 [Pseudomonas abyssi]